MIMCVNLLTRLKPFYKLNPHEVLKDQHIAFLRSVTVCI